MALLEIHYPAGVATGEHVPTHESVLYVVSGRVESRVGDRVCVLGPGDACRHPAGVPHSVAALEESRIVEVKSPLPDLDSVFGDGR